MKRKLPPVRRLKRVCPLPELADASSRKFTVTEQPHAQICLDSDPVQLLCPLTDAPHHYGARMHELGHLRWSPANPALAAKDASVPLEWLQVCEDARVNTRLAQAGIAVEWLSVPATVEPSLLAAVQAGQLEGLVQVVVARAGTTAEYILTRSVLKSTPIGKAALRIADSALRELSRHGQSFDGTVAAAKLLADTFATAAQTFPSLDSLFDGAGMSDGADPFGDFMRALDTDRRESCGPWGTMKIATPPCPCPCNPAFRAKTRTFGDSGLLPLAIHRLPTDGRIFATTHTERVGGSVLIDVSGSMHLPFSLIADWLRKTPLATVAIYSGHTTTGTLTLLAAKGMRVSHMPCSTGGGNIIDGPALQWLSKQPKPRVWVSDGETTGVHDNSYGSAYCALLCKLHGITRFGQFSAFLSSPIAQPAHR